MYILVIIILLCVVIIGSTIYFTKIEPYSPFINFDLHENPYANHQPYFMYEWWYDHPDDQKYRGCTQYRCQTQPYKVRASLDVPSLDNYQYFHLPKETCWNAPTSA